MLTQDFCNILEYKIGDALQAQTGEELAGFWCDGVLLPAFEYEYAPKTVNDKRKVVMTAYVGKTGQDRYELTLHFGPKALGRYARGFDIADCIPEADNTDWLEIDPGQCTMAVYLL